MASPLTWPAASKQSLPLEPETLKHSSGAWVIRVYQRLDALHPQLAEAPVDEQPNSSRRGAPTTRMRGEQVSHLAQRRVLRVGTPDVAGAKHDARRRIDDGQSDRTSRLARLLGGRRPRPGSLLRVVGRYAGPSHDDRVPTPGHLDGCVFITPRAQRDNAIAQLRLGEREGGNASRLSAASPKDGASAPGE